MTEMRYTLVFAWEKLRDALDSICGNLLLPPSQERVQLIDALKRAITMADPFYGTPEAGTAIWVYGGDEPGSFKEEATKIAACADQLLVAMKGDFLCAAKQGDWGPLKACLRYDPTSVFLTRAP
jgi:hypothetical protein